MREKLMWEKIKMKQILVTALLMGYVIALAGCKDNSPQVPDAELVGTLWTLDSVEPVGATAIKPDPTRTYTIQFFADSTFVGVVDCDDLFGQYWSQDGFINKFGTGGVTRRGCAEAVPSVDEYYPLGILNSGSIKYEISGNMLALHLDVPYQVGDDSILNFETSD